MNGIVITWPQLLYIGLALILFYVAELLLFLRKSGRTGSSTDRKVWTEMRDEQTRLQQEIESLKVRLATLLRQQNDSPIPPETMTLDSAPDTPYAQAIRLAQMGEDANAICHECGISRGEADLIVALYRTGTLH